MSNQGLGDQHAVVTGAGRGIGAAIATRLVADGARVTLVGRNRTALDAERTKLGAAAAVAVADVTDTAAVAAAFGAAEAGFGPIDILVCNAGQAVSAPALKTDDALWAGMLDVNLTGAWRCIRNVLPGMVDRRRGRIVNVASTAGLTGYAYVAAYCAAKHGLVGLTRALAVELATTGITVNSVCPGFTDTQIARDAVANIRDKTGRTAEQALAALVARNPQQRLIRPDEVANAVAWLCQPGSDAITGQCIAVAGGEIL
jgi:NAD(P)-dependent dehydrogenase (short-subunit alcohol dehydrogenase family)